MYPGSIGQPSANPIIRHFIWTRSISVTVATLQSSFSVVGRLFIYRLWTIWLAVARANRSGISSAIATAISSAMMIKSFRWSSSLGSQLLANCDDWSHLLSIWSCCKTVAHWAVFFSYLLNLVFFFFVCVFYPTDSGRFSDGRVLLGENHLRVGSSGENSGPFAGKISCVSLGDGNERGIESVFACRVEILLIQVVFAWPKHWQWKFRLREELGDWLISR